MSSAMLKLKVKKRIDFDGEDEGPGEEERVNAELAKLEQQGWEVEIDNISNDEDGQSDAVVASE